MYELHYHHLLSKARKNYLVLVSMRISDHKERQKYGYAREQILTLPILKCCTAFLIKIILKGNE
jgi:hypothetical protein